MYLTDFLCNKSLKKKSVPLSGVKKSWNSWLLKSAGLKVKSSSMKNKLTRNFLIPNGSEISFAELPEWQHRMRFGQVIWFPQLCMKAWNQFCSTLLLYDGLTSIKFRDRDTNLMATSQFKLTNFNFDKDSRICKSVVWFNSSLNKKYILFY